LKVALLLLIFPIAVVIIEIIKKTIKKIKPKKKDLLEES
jgi:hypothetical protein